MPAQPPAPSRRRRLGLLLALTLVGLLLLALLRPPLQPGGTGERPQPIQRRDKVMPIEQMLSTAEQNKALAITVGMHLENAYNLSIPDQTFMADGWYWLSWPQEVEDLIEANKIETDRMVEVVNNIVGFDFEVDPEYPEPQLRADGSRHQIYRFSGFFYVDDINLRDSPFNLLSLPLILETRPLAFTVDGPTPVLLQPEADRDGLVGGYATIRGFQDIGVSLSQKIHRYPTNFGEQQPRRDYSQVVLRVFYRTPPFASFVQWILPLLIVMLIVFLAPSLEGSLGDLRIAIPSTALLTLVVMQQTYQAELPPLPYLTFLDRIYLVSYLISIALFVLFLWASNLYAAAERSGADGAAMVLVRQRVKRADTWFQGLAVGGFLVVAYLAWVVG
jgi:hypothetical protein